MNLKQREVGKGGEVMSRRRAKVLSLILVFAMVLTSVEFCATRVDAAKARSLKVTNVKSKKLSLAVGQKKKLKVKVAPKSAAKNVKYKSSKKKVATVNKKGNITAKKAGKANITVSANKVRYVIKLTVTGKSNPTSGPNDPTPPQSPAGNVTVAPPGPTQPVESPRPTDAPATQEPPRTQSPPETQEPTGTPDPTSSTEPSGTPDPTSSTEPSGTPDPTNSTEPSGTPDPTTTPDPEDEVTLTAANGSIVADDGKFDVTVTFSKEPSGDDVVLSDVEGTEITLDNEQKDIQLTAEFLSINSSDNSVTYRLDAASATKMIPGDGSADGDYVISSDDFEVDEGIVVAYRELLLSANMIQGFVYDSYLPLPGATVKVDNGNEVSANEVGYYRVAATAGWKNIVAKSEGYFDNIMTDLDVKSNRNSAHNFQMRRYYDEELYVTGTVLDRRSNNPIEDAEVVLYESTDGGDTWNTVESKGVVWTDADGQFIFANSAAQDEDGVFFDAGDYIGDSSVGVFNFGEGVYANVDETTDYRYKAVLNKRLSAANLDHVYKELEVEFDMSTYADRTPLSLIQMNEVAAVDTRGDNGIKFKFAWDSETNPDYADWLDVNNNGSIALDITFFDSDKESILMYGTEDVDITSSGMPSYLEIIGEGFFGTDNGNNIVPTLPAGTYYLSIYDGRNAIAIIPMVLSEEGGSIQGEGVVKGTTNLQLTSQITMLTDREPTSTMQPTVGSNLKAVDADGEPIAAEDVMLGYDVFTKEGVFVKSVMNEAFKVYLDTAQADLWAPRVVSQIGALATNEEYIFRPRGDYTIPRGEYESTFKVTNSLETKQFRSGANVERIMVQSGRFISKLDNTSTPLADSHPIVVQEIRLLKQGIDPKEYTYEFDNDLRDPARNGRMTVGDVYNTGIGIPDNGFGAVEPGTYVISLQCEGFEEVRTAADFTLKDFERANLTIESDITKINNTSIRGQLIWDSPTRPNVDNMPVDTDSGYDGDIAATVMLYDEDGKIVAATHYYNDNQPFILVNGENGEFGVGTYTLVVRGYRCEITTMEVTIGSDKINDITSANMDIPYGGNAQVTATLTTTAGQPIDNDGDSNTTHVDIYDEYYIPLGSVDVNILAAQAVGYSGYIGAYALDITDWTKPALWETESILPMSDYTMDIWDGENVIYDDYDEFSITEIGQDKQLTRNDIRPVPAPLYYLDLTVAGMDGDSSLGYIVIVDDSTGEWIHLYRNAALVDGMYRFGVYKPGNYSAYVYCNDYHVGSRTAIPVQDGTVEETVGLAELDVLGN